MVQAGDSLTVNIMATDPDEGQIPSLDYSPALGYAIFTDKNDGTATLVFNPGSEVDPEPTIITITASSGELTAMEQFILTITPPDNPPVITPIENQMVQAGGSSITVNIIAIDPDGQIPSLDYSPALGYATFTDNLNGTATLVFNPGPEVDPVATNITITATSGELTAMEQFTLTITAPAVDTPPTIIPINNVSVQAGGSSITVNITAIDPDDGQTPHLSYSPELLYATFTDNRNGTATLVFNPGREVDPVATNIIITASSGELTAREQFILTITAPPDRPPSINPINNVSVQAGGSSITVNITATDPDDGQTPSLSYSPELLYATFTDNDNGTATLVIAPGREIPLGPTNITITASSGELTAREQFILTITAPPDRPPSINPINDVSVKAGHSLRVNITATDPDDGQTPTLSYSPELLYARLTDRNDGTATLVFNPGGEVDPGDTNITITANSAGLTDTEIFTLTITALAVDNPPTIDTITNISVEVGASLTVNISAFDPDGEIPTLSYSPELLYATFTDNRNGTATLVFNPGPEVDPGVTNITITANSAGLTDTEIFTLTITPSDSPPSINPINDVFVQVDTSLTVNITASDPDDGQTPSLAYSPILPYATLTTNDNGTATLVFNPGLEVPLGDTNITITASSGELTDIEQFTLTITNTAVDTPPTIIPINNVSVQAGGSSITVNITAIDPDDGQTPHLSYSPELLYATFTDNRNGTATLVFNPGREVDPVATNIIITASSGELTAREQFILTITAPPDRPPSINPINNVSVQAGGSSITVNITATDPDDGQTPSLSYSPELLYATFTDNDNGTATLVIAPGREIPLGPTNITITASSGELTAREQFILTITAPPDRPPSINPINDVSVKAGHSLRVNITATDPDDGQTPTLSYSPELLYARLTDRNDGTATLVFNPGGEVDPGAIPIIITASSGELTAREEFTLTITPDRPPVIASIIPNPVTVRAGESANVEVMAFDPDAGETPTLSLDGTQPTFVTIRDNRDGSALINIRPESGEPPDRITINVVATSRDRATMNGLTLNIAPADGPVIDLIIPNPVTVRAGETNRVTVTASDPDAGETPTLDLDGTEPTFVTIVDNLNGSATITIRPEAGEPPDTITINVVATSRDKPTTNGFFLIIVPLSAVDGDGDGVLDIDDVDDDNDGLIEINSLDDLDNIRYNLAGTSYKTSAIDAGNMNGAPGSGLNGYELTRDLDFNDPTNYSSGMVNTAWTTGEGWLPIGDNSTNDDSTQSRFTGILEGNGHKIANLMISRDIVYIGLFGYIDTTGQVRNLGIENAVAENTGNSSGAIGILAGASEAGTIIAVHTSGIADGGNGRDNVGGLVGNNIGTITACYATGNANGGEGDLDHVGGLVGVNGGPITACYATGMADGGDGNFDRVGGLVAYNNNRGTITACYATGNANGGEGNFDRVGGLVGWNIRGLITASYGFGMVTGEERAGVDRSGDADATVTNASALTMANSSTREENRWSTRVWDFGTDSQVPVLKWITGYDSSRTTEAERYPCDVALLPAGRECGDIIPGQER